MSLGIALTNALSSLQVNQEAMSVLSNNIANANSQNYTRREIVQSNQVVNGVSAGARIEEVKRAVDDFVLSAARQQISNVGQYDIQSTFLDRLSTSLGQPGAGNDIGSQVDNLFARLSELSNSTEQAAVRSNTLQSALSVTNAVSGLAQSIEKVRFDADQEISNQVTKINEALDTLANLNVAIKETTAHGGDKNSLFDSRDTALSALSKIIDVAVRFDVDGQVTLSLPKSELLSPTSHFRLSYAPALSVANIISGTPFNPVQIQLVDASGNLSGNTIDIAPASNDTTHPASFLSGSLTGLIDLRDTKLPALLEQVNEFAKTFADSFNAVQNNGVGFPPPSSLTGTRLLPPDETHLFSGSVRLAVLRTDGTPISSNFASGGLPPLTLNLDTLTSGSGANPGTASLNTMAREINAYFGPPPATEANIGSLTDLRLGSVSSSIASTKATGNIVFSGNLGVGDTLTINGTAFTMVAHGTPSGTTTIQLGNALSDTLQEITKVMNASALGTVNLATYAADTNTLTVTYDTAGTAPNGAFTIDANLTPGGTTNTANINGVGAAINPAASALGLGTGTAGVNANGNLTFDFEMSNIAAADATFEVTNLSINGGGATGQTLGPFTATSGLRQRTNLGGAAGGQSLTITVPAGLQQGDTFTITANVQVTAGDGTISTDTVTFTVTVPDPDSDITNIRYPATATGDAANLLTPASNSGYLLASVVDANGRPVTGDASGYLKLTALRSGTGIAFDEMDSSEDGLATSAGSNATGWGLSHFFGLNDFFTTGNALDTAAVNFAVRTGYATDPSRIATGQLTLSNQSSDTSANPVFTYETGVSNNKSVSQLAALKDTRQLFDAAGGLPAVSLTFGGYTSQIFSAAALQNQNAHAALDQQTTLYNAFADKLKSSGGVNVDEELANTVLFQNNFAASARLISIISDMFDKMIQSF